MARRVVMGRMSDGTYDVRMSRAGYDALTGDIDNPRVISFSAQASAKAKVGAAGVCSSLNSWVSFGQTFDNPPPTIAALKQNNRVVFNYYEYLDPPESNAVFYGTPYCLIVQANRIRAIQCINWGDYAFPSGSRFLFYTLSQD